MIRAARAGRSTEEGWLHMKIISLAVVVVCLCAATAYPYDRTFIGDQTEVGGFMGFAGRLIETKGEVGILAGGRMEAVISHNWGIGGGGYGTVAGSKLEDLEGLSRLDMAYGGMVLEYVFKPHAIFHVCVPVLVGGGQVQFVGDYVDPESGQDSDLFFVIEPEFNLELNVTRNLRVDLGVAYRHVNGTELTDFTDEDLSGVNGVLAVKIGAF
jgi:hypothetical protein